MLLLTHSYDETYKGRIDSGPRKRVNARIYNVQAQQNLADVVSLFGCIVINANVCPWDFYFILFFTCLPR